ncbi:MAG: hypothetical protein ACE145_16220 [Terriglobia bacterium]
MRKRLAAGRRVFFGGRSRFGIVALLLVSTVIIPVMCRTLAAAEGGSVVWSIGKPDGSSIEFADDQRERATFIIGKDVVKRDFPARQLGSVNVDARIPSKERAYSVVFDMSRNAQPTCQIAPLKRHHGSAGRYLLTPHSTIRQKT